MPSFLVLGHTQTADPDEVRLNDLPGASGRWDVLARCVAAALLVSHGVRSDADVVLYLARAERYLRIIGREVRNLNPDERSTVALLSKALAARPVGHHEEAPLPGVRLGASDLPRLLGTLGAGRRVILLDESAPPDDGDVWPKDALYVLSDHQDPTAQELDALDRAGAVRRGLGPEVLQADQAIVLVHDRVGRVQGSGEEKDGGERLHLGP